MLSTNFLPAQNAFYAFAPGEDDLAADRCAAPAWSRREAWARGRTAGPRPGSSPLPKNASIGATRSIVLKLSSTASVISDAAGRALARRFHRQEI